jgi:hypothetical protein
MPGRQFKSAIIGRSRLRRVAGEAVKSAERVEQYCIAVGRVPRRRRRGKRIGRPVQRVQAVCPMYQGATVGGRQRERPVDGSQRSGRITEPMRDDARGAPPHGVIRMLRIETSACGMRRRKVIALQ